VRNSYDQVFKCLSNDGGDPSTIMPLLSPGTTDPTQTLYLADGYKWIYVTTIDKGQKQKFFDSNWMPINIGQVTPNTLVPVGFGSINAINVTNSTSDFSNGLATTTVTITGDGTGATAYANVSSNVVSDVIVTNAGNNYTFATVTIAPALGYSGTSATANAIISPIGGHGYDPVSELGCNHIMLSMEFDGNEGGNVPTNNVAFRQVGVLINPLLDDGTIPLGTIYNTSDTATVSFGTGVYNTGEVVYQGLTSSNSTFSATVSSFDSTNNIISLINTQGTYVLGETLTGVTSTASRILLSYTPTNFNIGSGYMMYYENREPVTRTQNDNQQIRLVLKF
jgi:hypothetical protein